jgi:hypothetical protein
MRFAEGAVVLLAVAACTGVKDDFDDICHAEERVELTGVSNPAEKAMKLSFWLQRRLRTSTAKDFLAKLATMDPADKGNALRAEAAKHGVSPCPIADSTWGAH